MTVGFLSAASASSAVNHDFNSHSRTAFWVWRRFGVFKIEIPPFPNYAGHGERMMKRESVQRALAFEREVQAQAAKAA